MNPSVEISYLFLFIQKVQIHRPLPSFLLNVKQQNPVIAVILRHHHIIPPLFLYHLVLYRSCAHIFLESLRVKIPCQS